MDQKRFGLPFWKLGSPNRRTTDVRSPNPVDPSIAGARAVVKKDAAGAIGSSVDSGVTLVTIAAPEVVAKIVDLFTNVENLIGDIERAVRKGMTNASFGLGPTALGDFDAGVGETPKPAHGPGGEPPKPAHGPGGEPPKPAHGGLVFEVGTSSQPSLGADLRVDLAMARVADLFRQVGDALKGLEQAASSGETTAAAVLSGPQGQTLGREDLLAAAAEITQALSILEDASRSARRTVRRVLSHPMYGLGPSSGTMGFEGREALASAGGLDARNLRLLARLPDASRPNRRN
jgi:hypothetical protein